MKSILAIIVVFLIVCTSGIATAYVVDHNSTNLESIPEAAINQAKNTLHIAYGHTSHGSQLITGMTGLDGQTNLVGYRGDIYQWNEGGSGGALDIDDYFVGGDLGHNGSTAWANSTRTYLDNSANNDVNIVIWSWCGGCSDNTPTGIQTYLDTMNQLETDYPDVTFVYMTGHADAWHDDTVKASNAQIRNYCIANNKVLYDFFDIESYDPDGQYYEYVGDNCNYYNASVQLQGNWATEWQNSHTEGVDWYQCTSAHSEPLNANRKAYAAWWLWARIAGWDGGVGADTEDPTIPQNLDAAASSHSQINLSWNASTDNVAVTGYRIFRSGSEIATTPTTAYNNTGLAASSTYTYTVLAYDAAGNSSNQSTSATATTLPPSGDTEAPTVPQNLAATTISSTRVDLSWDTSSDNVAVTGYKIFRDGTEIANSLTTSYSNNGLTASTTYIYRVSAYDAAGNLSSQSSPTSVTTQTAPDTEPPTIPQSLNASVISANEVALSWDDSSDNTGVAGYKVYYKQGDMSSPLDGTGATEGSSPIDVGDVITASVSGLTNGVTYYFAVTAYDAAGNESDDSNIVSNQWMPELQEPNNRAVNIPLPLTFRWSDDAAQRNVTYTLYYSTDPTAELGAIFTPSAGGTPSSWNGTVSVAATLFALSLLLLWSAPKTRIRYRYAFLTLGTALVLTACGGGSGGSSSGGGSHSAATVSSFNEGTSNYHETGSGTNPELTAGTTYYWRVVATNTTDSSVKHPSETYQFTTEN